MAVSFQKNYSIDVAFTRDDGEALADSDLNCVEMRNEISAMIKEVCLRSMGIFEARPGDVTET